jgi:type VI secretion system secreted protein Hcp
MAKVDYFLKIDGIEGESSDRDHKGEIEIVSFSWGLSQLGDASGGGGAGGGKATLQDFHFTASFNKASPQLMLACANGQHIKQGTLTGRAGGKGTQEFYKVKLNDIIISSYQTAGSEGEAPPGDQFSLNFAKIEFNTASGDSR